MAKREPATSSTALVALNAAVIDTETTGLDVRTARIVQFGGVRMSAGTVDMDACIDLVVNPGCPIPAAASAIHGIADEDVATAASFADIAAQIEAWLGDDIMLGYSIGFDLAILAGEYRRAGRRQPAWRALDVRQLVQLVAPALPDTALETVAGWLNVATDKRHNALADAVMTAQVMIKLAPLLKKKGIVTLAEAEAACRALVRADDKNRAAGWHDVAHGGAGDGKRTAGALARVDSFPYRHRNRDLMKSPPKRIAASRPLAEAARTMLAERVSSLIVGDGDVAAELGILTERDILRAIGDDSASGLARRAGDVASRPLEVVAADAFVYRAIGRMARCGFRHLGVVDDEGKLVGVLSMRDLLRQRAEDAISLGDAIDQAASSEDLAAVWSRLALVAGALARESVDARDIAAVISRELCALTRQACRIAETAMAADGLGPAPVDYAMAVLGSGGRGESLLAMDQDNAIISAEGGDGSPEDRWLGELGTRVADILDSAGVPYCKGGVMARNRQWRRSVADWRRTVDTWVTRHRPEDILNTDIFFDARVVHGSWELGEQVLSHAFAVAASSRQFLQLLEMNAAKVTTPIGWFGRFRLTGGRMDLKMGGIMPIFSAARVLAIRHGVRARSTPQRLEAVRGKPNAPGSLVDRLIEAHRIILGAILAQQLRDLDDGVKLSNNVDPNWFDAHDKRELKWALEQVDNVASLLGDPVGM